VKKWLCIFVVFILLAIGISVYKKPNTVAKPDANQTEKAGETAQPEPETPASTVEGDTQNPADPNAGSTELKSAGVYIGQIDSSFIMIETEGKAQSFKLSGALKEAFEQLDIPEGAAVKFTYQIEQNGQTVIQTLTKE
jgi:hypothetical protein